LITKKNSYLLRRADIGSRVTISLAVDGGSLTASYCIYPPWCVVVVHHMKEPMSASAMSERKGEESLLIWKLIKGLGFIKLIELVFTTFLNHVICCCFMASQWHAPCTSQILRLISMYHDLRSEQKSMTNCWLTDLGRRCVRLAPKWLNATVTRKLPSIVSFGCAPRSITCTRGCEQHRD
jgi:hypothetical protein